MCNLAASTTFNGVSQSCTNMYWMLIGQSVESTDQLCNTVQQSAGNCCYQMPTHQCTLCYGDNGISDNTRRNKEVTVNGMTKTCGVFNTLLSTQESNSLTCSMAKDEIFNECCFCTHVAASALVASSDTGIPCNVCKPGQSRINADIVFNGNNDKCADVYTFLVDEFKEGSDTFVSAQTSLSDKCCQDPGTWKINFASWTIKSKGKANVSLTSLCIGTASVASFGLFLLSCIYFKLSNLASPTFIFHNCKSN